MSGNKNSVNLKLVRDMGAPYADGYNPIAPRSHRWMMDFRELEETRVHGWALWRTIDVDPLGKMGPAKKKRTSVAHDERVARREHLWIKEMADDLGMTVANATDALRRAVEKGLVGAEEERGIWARGDAPLPRRIKSKNPGEGDDGEEPIFFCTEKSPEAYRLIFQQLDKKRRAQYVRLYRTMPEPLAEHYEKLDPEPRARHTWNYLQAAEYKEQLEADAAAAARSIGRGEVDRVTAESGYVDEETRGRKEVKRELTIELKVRVEPATFYIQKAGPNSVQNGNSILYKGENGAVQKSASLLVFQSDSSQSDKVSGAVEIEESSENPDANPTQTPTARPHPHSQNLPEKVVPDEPAADPLSDPDPLISYVQHKFKRRLGSKDILRTQLPMLPAQFGIPVSGVRLFWDDLFQKKQQRNYEIETPGALYEFTAVGKDGRQPDLAIWIRRNGERIAAAARRDEANGIRPEPEFAPETRELQEQVRTVAANKTMSAGGQK